MRTRFVMMPAVLLSLAALLALSACNMLTDANPSARTSALLSPGHEPGGTDSSGTSGPPPPPASGFSIGVSGDSLATAGHQAFLQLFVLNNDAAAATVNFRFSGPQGWSGFPATGSLAIPGNASATANITVAVPGDAAPGAYLFHYDIEKPDGTAILSGDFSLAVHPS